MNSPSSLAVWIYSAGLGGLFGDWRWGSFFFGVLFAAVFILIWANVTNFTSIGEWISYIKRYTRRSRSSMERKRHSSHRRPRDIGK